MHSELNAVLVLMFILSSSMLRGQNTDVDRFGKSYNEVRIQLGIPIIEESWLRDSSSTSTRVKWMNKLHGVLPKDALHLAKFVRFEDGRLTGDEDIYSKFISDSINYRVFFLYKFESKEWLSKLQTYHYNTSPPGLEQVRITVEQADSIINSWGLSRKPLRTK
jgi:hypothetical protein